MGHAAKFRKKPVFDAEMAAESPQLRKANLSAQDKDDLLRRVGNIEITADVTVQDYLKSAKTHAATIERAMKGLLEARLYNGVKPSEARAALNGACEAAMGESLLESRPKVRIFLDAVDNAIQAGIATIRGGSHIR